jgi:hypothetical protein
MLAAGLGAGSTMPRTELCKGDAQRLVCFLRGEHQRELKMVMVSRIHVSFTLMYK